MEQQQIIDAVSDLIGQPFTPIRGQWAMPDDTDTAEQIIACFPNQLASIRASIAEGFPELTADDVPKHIAATQMYLARAVNSVGGDCFKDLSWQQAAELGRIAGGKQLDPVRVMYQAILGREPDDAGYAFWSGHYQDGIPLSELCRYMEREKAAGAT